MLRLKFISKYDIKIDETSLQDLIPPTEGPLEVFVDIFIFEVKIYQLFYF